MREKLTKEEKFIQGLGCGILGFIFWPCFFIYDYGEKKDFKRSLFYSLFFFCLAIVFEGAYFLWKDSFSFPVLFLSLQENEVFFIGFQVLAFWSLLASLSFLFLPFRKKVERLTVKSFKKKPCFKNFYKSFRKKEAPLGISFKSHKIFSVNQRQRLEHVLVCGATGMGKSTLMASFLLDGFLKKYPLIIIDPKGEKGDICFLKELFLACGRKREDFKLFSLANPKESVFYNPLERGTPQQIKAKLIDGLEFSHEFYKAQASQFLGSLIESYSLLKKPLSFKAIHNFFNSKALQKEILDEVSKKGGFSLIGSLKSALATNPRDLAGLTSQIDILNASELQNLSHKKENQDEIKLLKILEKNQVAYFQMNVNGYGDLARRLGKMIIQDLKVLSSQIHARQVSFKPYFCGVFIDEFGSFASKDFADFLKQVRSAGLGCHLFFQTLADLKAVSPQFEDQVLGNTALKVIFRQDVPKDCEKLSRSAGTVDDYEETRQISDKKPTGLGSLSETKKMKIEFDLLKTLKRGQAVIIDKLSSLEDVVKIYKPTKEDIEKLQKGGVKQD